MAIEALKSSTLTYQGRESATDYKDTKVSYCETKNNIDTSKKNPEMSNDMAQNLKNSSEYNYQQSNEAIKKAVEQINKMTTNTTAQFDYHEETNRIIIKIIDKDTKEVIREIPPEKTLDMIAKVWEIAGLLIDEKR